MTKRAREIPGWPGYSATADGAIIGRRGRPLKPKQRADGYHRVSLYDGERKRVGSVHRLVCAAFHGKQPRGKRCAAHRNGIRSDNRSRNLRWLSHAENAADMVRHGTRLTGERHPRALLTREEVSAIRRKHADNMGARYVKRGVRAALAREYGVGVHVIKDIVGGRSWS